MKILVACEFSGVVREAFAKEGHDAWSCDLLPTEIPGKHIKGNVLEVLKEDWDLMIAHPPCTDLAVSGARHFYRKGLQQEKAVEFFMKLVEADIPRIAIENPVCIMSTRYRKPDQIVHPWMFGEEFSKRTCLWLKGLPKLTPTEVVGKGEMITFKSGKRMSKWYASSYGKGHLRSKTFQGIAEAMSTQWRIL